MRSMELDRNGLEILDRAEALRLLAQARIGRIGIHADALPVVLPVNFVLDGDEIVIGTDRGTKLDAATRNAVVAFEADEIDATYHTGWSVLVTGMAREVTDREEIARMQGLPLAPWTRSNGRFIAVSTEMISGRRILAAHGS